MEYLCVSPGRRYCRQERQEASSESFGEVRAAIPFNWEEAPGRPKLQQHISSLVNNKRIIREGATGFDDVELGDKQLNPPIVQPTTRPLQQRPWTTQFGPAELDFSTRRFQADQMLATSVGKITEDVIIRHKIPAKVTPSTGSAFLYSSARFQAERPYKSEEFVIGQRLPLPPRLRALKNQVAPDSRGTGIQQFQTILGVENQLPDSRHDGSGHRRALSLSGWIAEVEASLGEEDDDDDEEEEEEEEEEGFSFRYMHGRSKDTRPTFLKNKMEQRWRKLDLQGHLSDEFVCNKVVDHSSTENTKRISLEFSSPQHSHNDGFSKERLLEKQNALDDVPKAAASSGAVSCGCSFRNLAAALLARKSKSSSRTASSRSSPAAISPHDFHVPADLSAREEETTVPDNCRECRPGRHKAPRLTNCFAIGSPCQRCHNLHGLTPGYESL
ncbi:unnamed protein product [Sphagnum balticum]